MIPWAALTPRAWAALVFVVLFAGLVANTYRLSGEVDSARSDLSAAQANLKTCRESNARLDSAINTQNAEIDRLSRAANVSQERAKEAIAKADEAAKTRESVRTRLQIFHRAPDETDCTATRRLLLEYPR